MPKKDLDKWCKGKVGVNHTPKVAKKGRYLGENAQCRYVGKVWVCTHFIQCGECGRLLKYEWQMNLEDCPTYAESHRV